MDKIYDMIIIGGGPAGYTAALYAARAGLDAVLVEKVIVGGQMTQTMAIDNYPGIPETVDGYTLGMQMQQGAERFGAKTRFAEVTSVELTGAIKQIHTDEGLLSARTVVIATGADHRHLGLAEEESLIGRGVGYCAACDGMLYRNKTVAVVGGGESAAADALHLSKICKKVYLIHRRDTLRAAKAAFDALLRQENVELILQSEVVGLQADGKLQSILVKNRLTGETQSLDVQGLFISIGRDPASALFAGQLELDQGGYIRAGESTETSLPGVFAVGDVRTKTVRQIVTAAADGAVAVHYAQEYLQKNPLA
ncbi:MAG: thioredoxin-disulfide reductase [Oscillospiraceae bacterium]|nr:thioredoxin-disulfide reductase [Oscillospiraceae bacterium]